MLVFCLCFELAVRIVTLIHVLSQNDWQTLFITCCSMTNSKFFFISMYFNTQMQPLSMTYLVLNNPVVLLSGCIKEWVKKHFEWSILWILLSLTNRLKNTFTFHQWLQNMIDRKNKHWLAVIFNLLVLICGPERMLPWYCSSLQKNKLTYILQSFSDCKREVKHQPTSLGVSQDVSTKKILFNEDFLELRTGGGKLRP